MRCVACSRHVGSTLLSFGCSLLHHFFWLQFVHVPPASTSAPASAPPPAASLNFVSIPPSDSLPLFRAADAPSSGPVIELDSFLAMSENGVLATPALENAAVRVCKIEGASVRLQ